MSDTASDTGEATAPAVDLDRAEAQVDLRPIGDRKRYDALMEVVRNRVTTRAFDNSFEVPREHYELILDAARHSPSGANAQPWHFVVVTEQATKDKIADYFVEEQRFRAKMKMKFPTPDYRGLASAPGMIVGPQATTAMAFAALLSQLLATGQFDGRPELVLSLAFSATRRPNSLKLINSTRSP